MTTPECMIHTGTEDRASNLLSPRDHESWTTLLRAARLKGHKVILDLCDNLPEGNIPNVYYHRKCRQMFTMKRDLTKHEKENDSMAISPRKSARERDKRPTSILDKACIFCPPGRSNKYLKSSNSRELLTQCLELQADDTIRKAVLEKEDKRLLPLVTTKDLVAAEAWYHKSCYKRYTKGTRKTNDDDVTPDKCIDQEDKVYKEAEETALDFLYHFIRTDFVESPRVMALTDMTAIVSSKMTELGILHIRQSTRKHIKRKLQHEFESTLQFTTSDKGKVLVFPDKMSREELVRENQNLTEELEITKLSSEKSDSLLVKAAAYLRKAIKQYHSRKMWPFIPDKIKDMFKIPSPVKTFFCSVITGEPSPSSISQRSEWLVDSFSQDMMYAVSRGAITPPKHILLPNAVKSLTGNVEIIRALNRLGHGISYTTLEENETELALSKLSGESQHIGLSEAMKPHVFTTLSWDNIDRLEETLTGAGTTHRVNGISVQPLVFGPEILTAQTTKSKSGRRSIDIPEQQLPIYNAGRRQGPVVLQGEDNRREEASREALDKTIIWMISRLGDQSDQIVTGWTGFNILIRNKHPVVPDKITYLPTINAPATDLSTVNEILSRSLAIKDCLHLQNIVIVFVQYKGISSKQSITQWREFLLRTNNKTELVKYLVEEWQQSQSRDLLGNRVLYVTRDSECFMINKNGSVRTEDLQSSQEEADTRLLLHSAHAADQGFQNILMISDDTDVFVMCLMYSLKIKAKIFMKTGSRLRVQYINIHAISAALGESVCVALPGLHAFTGCDSVSAFAGQGKLSALKLIRSDSLWQDTFKELGSEMETSQTLQKHLEEFTCLLYSAKTNTKKVNKLRYEMFASRKGKIEPHQLPPCADALQKHIQRANYQCAIWRNSLVQMPEIPLPTGHGWKLDNENLIFDWMDGSPAPESVLELISCPCRKNCTLPQCICLANKLKCSELCRLTDCSNQPDDEDIGEGYSSSEDSESDEEFSQ